MPTTIGCQIRRNISSLNPIINISMNLTADRWLASSWRSLTPAIIMFDLERDDVMWFGSLGLGQGFLINWANISTIYFILFGQVLVPTIWFLYKLRCKTVSSHLKFGFEDLKGQFQDLLPCIKDSIVRNGCVILVNTTGRLANVN